MYLLFAQTNATDVVAPKPVNLTVLAFKTLVVLGITALLIYIVVKLLSKFTAGRYKGANVVNVLVDFPVRPGKSIVVVEILGKTFVLAVSDSDIHPVAWMEDQEWVDALSLAAQESPPKTFGDFVKEIFGRSSTHSGGGFKGDSALSYLMEKLKNIKKKK